MNSFRDNPESEDNQKATRENIAAVLTAQLEESFRKSEGDKVIDSIALKYLDIETLKTNYTDDSDFHDIAVWSLKSALEAAYEAGGAAAIERIKNKRKEPLE